MIFNDKTIELGTIEANYEYWIVVQSKDKKIKICFGFNREKYDFRKMKINDKIDLIKYLYWDTSLEVGDTYYLFDLSKEKVILTKMADNKYRLEVNIENPDMIYSPLGDNASFKNLIIDTELSFNYDYKPPKDDSILKIKTEKSNINLFDVLDKL